MELIRIISFFALVVLVSSCASLSKDECVNADWRLIGYEDGSNGAGRVRIGQHRKACADHGVVPKTSARHIPNTRADMRAVC